MIIQWLLVSTVVFKVICPEERTKRVVNGQPFNGRPNTYSVIKYYGVLGSAHKTWFTFGFVIDIIKNFGWYGEIACSGALLTPAIFQTACHCVSTFDKNSKEHLKPAIVRNHWEQISVAYLGVSSRFGGEHSMITDTPILTERYAVHSKCAKFEKSDALTHDYALVQIDSDWIKADGHFPFNWLEIDWAPQYTSQDMIDFHKYALEKQLVCLLLGFGVTTNDPNSQYASDELRHGWGALISHNVCVPKTTTIKGLPREYLKGNLNWVCTEPFPKHNQNSGKGDSGSPTTCENKYFGIVSGLTNIKNATTNKLIEVLTKHHTLIHNLFANSANFRNALINKFYRLKNSYKDLIIFAKSGIKYRKFVDFQLKQKDKPKLVSRAYKQPCISAASIYVPSLLLRYLRIK